MLSQLRHFTILNLVKMVSRDELYGTLVCKDHYQWADGRHFLGTAKLREGSLTVPPGSCSSAGPVAAHLRCSVICSSESANNEQKANISSEAQINNVTASSGAEGPL